MDDSGNNPNISDASSGAGLSSSLELQSEPDSGSEDNEAPLDSPIDDKAQDMANDETIHTDLDRDITPTEPATDIDEDLSDGKIESVSTGTSSMFSLFFTYWEILNRCMTSYCTH